MMTDKETDGSLESLVEIVARGMAQAIGDPDGLEPGDDPYGNNQSTVDGYNSNGEPCHFFWRGYVGNAQAALSAITEAGYEIKRDEPSAVSPETTGQPYVHPMIRPLVEQNDRLHLQNAKLRQLDVEASNYVESVIVMRTNFTGDPPYVGWKGLGLALAQALDERDELRRKLESDGSSKIPSPIHREGEKP